MKGTIKIYVKPEDDDRYSVGVDMDMDDFSKEDGYAILQNLMTVFEFTKEDMQCFCLMLLLGKLHDLVVEAVEIDPNSAEGKAFREQLETEFGAR